ncbi:hypothetical protein [Alistipes sp.]|uniref:hypothetical protein n=1 Tax=Alistipes sp. TaxID=1872444 RepID=UPI0025C5547A|nr:hypothetical protein [Alistipes sp.]
MKKFRSAVRADRNFFQHGKPSLHAVAHPIVSHLDPKPGSYTATFVVANGNYQGQSTPTLYEVTFTVIDPLE